MAGTHRIDLEEFDAKAYPGGYVEIRDFLSWDQKNAIDFAGMSGERRIDGSVMIIAGVEMAAKATAYLEVGIVEWSLDLPLPAGIHDDEFPAMLGEWLLRKIRDYYEGQERSDDDRKNSVQPSTARSSAAAGGS